MNKQIKTDEGKIIELDETLVKLIKSESYCIDDDKCEGGGHFCIRILDILENDNAADTVFENGEDVGALYENEEIFAFWLQQNGYGNVKKAVEEFAECIIDLIPNDKELQDKIRAKVDEL